MTAKQTPGRRLRKALDAAVADRGLEWSETDLALTLPQVETVADRLDVLRSKLAEETARQGPVAVRVTQLAGEIRQTEGHLGRLVKDLGIDQDDEPARPESPTTIKARRAANARWARG